MDDPRTADPMVAALLREREGYVRAGKPERAQLVTQALAARGYVDPESERDPEPTPTPRNRQGRPRSTAA